MLVAVELATALAWDAARAERPAPAEAELAAAAAAAPGHARRQECAQKAIQIFGGIGFTWEHDAHLYLRRAAALAAVVDAEAAAEDDVNDRPTPAYGGEHAVELPAEAETYPRRGAARSSTSVTALAPEGEAAGLIVVRLPGAALAEPFGRGAGAIEQLVIEEELPGRDRAARTRASAAGCILTLIQHAHDRNRSSGGSRPASTQRGASGASCSASPTPAPTRRASAPAHARRRRLAGQRPEGVDQRRALAGFGLATVRTDPDAPKHTASRRWSSTCTPGRRDPPAAR